MKSIPVDRLVDKTNSGLLIKSFHPDEKLHSAPEDALAHRDDHYIFFLCTDGSGRSVVDFREIIITAGQLYYILPSQVHYRIRTDRARGWFLAVDTFLIAPEFRDVFEHRADSHSPCPLTGYELKQYSTLLGLLYEEYAGRSHDRFYLPVIHTLVQSFLGMAAATYATAETVKHPHSRSAELARQFKKLLAAHIHTIKSPAAYASRLNVSLGYLNEAIKKVTGATVSYWIQQELLSEAKRLLFYSNDDVKQIAQALGYSDHAYFSRSFRKAAGVSPLEFRVVSRKNV